MKSNLSIFGIGGHAKVLIESAILNDFTIDCLYDDDVNKSNLNFGQYKIIGPIDINFRGSLIIAIGNNKIRKQISDRIAKANWRTIIHPTSIISKEVLIGEGSVIMAGAIIQPDTRIGKHAIINTGVSIDHDCYIGDYVHISPKVALSGDVYVGDGAHIGVGACVIPGIKIGKWATIGAGAVIIKDVPDYAVVVGNPGRLIKYNYE
jgi:sugar O-acyltransferase (sialic acid O-acetyltransferase NeuD family)